MEKLRFKYLDEKFKKEGTERRGNKGCVAKLATSAKGDLVGEDGRKKYKRKNTNDITFNEEQHVVDLPEMVHTLLDTTLYAFN
jgi:hypothetical protein